MSNISLNVGLKALLVAQSALDTVGHNVSNANTPGYSRQRLGLAASPALLLRGTRIGNGVDATEITRATDGLLSRRILLQKSSLGALTTRLSSMSQVESLLGEPGEFGLSTLVQNMFTSFSRLASSPSDPVLRTGAVQASVAATSQFNQLAQNISTLKSDTAEQVAAQVQQANVLTNEVVSLNREIAKLEAGGAPANDLRDQREESLRKLSELINITTTESQNGSTMVLSGGQLLVGPTRAYAITSKTDAQGEINLSIAGGTKPLDVKSGSLGGLLQISQNFVPGLTQKLDTLAKNMIAELNRAHSTGMPASGPFASLTSTYSLQDVDGDGDVEDELLANAGLPFDIQAGKLRVNVTDASTGLTTQHDIEIDPSSTTVRDFVEDLNSLPNLSAALDSFGRLQVLADGGFGFDFSRRLNGTPDVAGSFGGAAASLTSAGNEPFALSDGDTLTLQGSSSTFTVALDAADFQNIGEATAEELVAALNADPNLASNSLRAVVVGDAIALQSVDTGAAQTFTVQGGTALGALGWSSGQVVNGQENAVDVALTGSYLGDDNELFTFRPNTDGTIGTTNGLVIDVFDSAGQKVASLDVGEDYEPGTVLNVVDGLRVSFGFGQVSATDHDAFTVNALHDSDTSDVLVALGLNALMTGTSAGDIALREDIALDPSRIATGMTGAEGDNRTLLDLLDVQQQDIAGLGDVTVGEFYGDFVSTIGFDISSTSNSADTETFLLDSLNARREEISGVNVDEELVDMIQFQQAYGAAAQFIQVVSSLNQELLSML